MHPDTRRSASVNVNKGAWFCHAGCGGGSVRQLVMNRDSWVPLDGRQLDLSFAPSTAAPLKEVLPTLDQVEHWHRRLRREADVRRVLEEGRGLTARTLRSARVGWNGKHYTIPVFSPKRRLWNVRRYDPHPRPGRSKMWNTKGMGQPRLYPIGPLDRAGAFMKDVFFVEGEWDALMVLQHGHLAVTTTAGAGKPWQDEWTEYFVGMNVYLCCDADRMGHKAEEIAADALADVARVKWCRLPYREALQGGKDISDYLLSAPERQRDKMLNNLKTGAVE